MSGYGDWQWCNRHGDFHFVSMRDYDCEFEDDQGNVIDPGEVE